MTQGKPDVMKQAAVLEHVIKPIRRYCNDPRTNAEESEAVFLDFVRMLSRFDPVVLIAATERLLEGMTKRSWPLPGQMVEICKAVAAEKRIDAIKAGIVKPRRDPNSLQSIAEAEGLIRSDLGRQAERDGWLLELYEFCRRHGSLPAPEAVMKLREEASRSEQRLAHLVANGEPDPRSLDGITLSTIRGRREIVREKLAPAREAA